MKNLIAVIFISLIFIASNCEQPKPIVVDCEQQIDSVNKYWVDVIKNLNNPIDSTLIDTVTVYDTLIIFKDSVSIRDSVSLRDSTVVDTLLINPVETIEIFPDSVKVDSTMSWQTERDAARNLFDEFIFIDRNGDTGTRWAVQGYPHAAMIYFDTSYVVTDIWINTFGWNEGYTHDIELYYYGTLLKTISTKQMLWSKHKLFYVGEHLYINIVAGKNSYSDLGGIRLFGYKRGIYNGELGTTIND